MPVMIKNYIKIALRNLLRHKSYSLINIGGLAIGFACCIAIGLYIWDEYSYDRFHTHYDEIYRIVEQQNQAGALHDVPVTPGPLAPVLMGDFPEILQTCRIRRTGAALIFGELTIEQSQILVVDNSFFSLFDFRLVLGNPQKVLLSPDEIVITENMAVRIFGSDWQRSSNLLGQQIQLNNGRILTLAGVAQNSPINSHIQFDVLLSCHFDELSSPNHNWNSNYYLTYILLNPEADAMALNEKLFNHLDKYKPESNITLSLQPLSDIYLHSVFAEGNWCKTGDIIYVQIFLAVGSVVLLIALFNFINLSTARAMNRAKEVGVRKVAGGLRKQLITQFLSESLIMTLLAVCSALLLVQLFLPVLNDISGKSLKVPLRDPSFEFALFAFTLITSLLSGMYPAFYLSGFQPVKVLKGSFVVRSGMFFRRSLVVSQFAFSIILITGTIVIYKQLIFLQHKNLGFDQSHLLYIPMVNELRTKALLIKTELVNHTSIAGVATTSDNLVNLKRGTTNFEWEGKQSGDSFLMTHLDIDADFLSTTEMTLVAGRNFNPAIISDTSSAYLINETAATRMGWTSDQALGKTINFSKMEGRVIGVVKDFHFRSLAEKIEPLLFHCWPRESSGRLFAPGLLVKAKANQVQDAISVIEKIYKKYERKTAPYYQFVDQALQNQYRAEQNTARIILYFSILAILVSSLGLFGLATYTAEQRIKEIGVRKVLGASTISILSLLSTDFLKLVLIAIVIASPIAWWSMNLWMKDFAYKIAIEWWIFVLSGLAAVSIALLTISFQSIKAAWTNPVKNLRTE
jgi:putative ABC transport system permease protein